MEFFTALLSYTFLQNALIGGLLASVACGIAGSYVVVKRIGYLAGGIAHSVLGGMGIAYYLGSDPMIGALCAAIVSALTIGLVSIYWGEKEDTLISAIWALGMSTGILFISQTPGYNIDLMGYLFGNILMIPDQELIRLLILDLVLIAAVVIFNRPLLAIVFDQEFARLRGLNTTVYYLLLLCLIAITVVMLIRVVGLILVIALLTLPAAIAGHVTQTLKQMMFVAVALGMLFTSSGLALSYSPDLPPGAVIILIAVVGYIGVFLVQQIKKQWGRQ